MIYTLLIGLIIGAVAKLIMPGKDPGGFIVTMLLGVAGAYLAYFIGFQTGMYTEGAPAGFFASVIGAVVILAAYRMFSKRNTHLPRY
jgi:uncharacterized membrane protein YeaQ/YmgE (transglycosylase-associated protein family)